MPKNLCVSFSFQFFKMRLYLFIYTSMKVKEENVTLNIYNMSSFSDL